MRGLRRPKDLAMAEAWLPEYSTGWDFADQMMQSGENGMRRRNVIRRCAEAHPTELKAEQNAGNVGRSQEKRQT